MLGTERVLVLGAGLAGLSAAERLRKAGLDVTIIDSFPLPGGRFASFEASKPVAGLQKGDVVEHGLHGFFQHYHAVYGLMKRAGLPKPPFAGNGVYFFNPEYKHYIVEGGPLTWLFDALRLPEDLRGDKGPALSAFGKLTAQLRSALANAEQTDSEDSLSLLRRFGVPEPAIDNVFRPCMYSLTSLNLERLSALEMLRWMSAILPDPRMRSLQGGGSQALAMPIADYLRDMGVEIRLGIEVEEIAMGDDGTPQVKLIQAPDKTGLRHVLVEGFEPPEPPEGPFDAVVCTLPWEKLVALADSSLVRAIPDVFDRMKQLHNIHPLTVRLWFERPIEGAEERYILSRGTLVDVLRPTPEAHRDGIFMIDALVENIDLHLPELGYDRERYIDPGPAQDMVLNRVLDDLEMAFPGQIHGNPLRTTFVHTREGIIACDAGVWSLRPPAYVGLQRFVLAGDYTQQPYGVCMEGATRSGIFAAEALLAGAPVRAERSAFGQLAYSAYSAFAR